MTAQTPTPAQESAIFKSPTYRLIASKLRQDPAEFIESLRQQEPPVSFARIADTIQQRTGEYVTDEIPRRWFIELQRVRAAAKVTD